MINWATNPNTLRDQLSLSLEARCQKLVDRYGPVARIDSTTLANYYKERKIRYRYPLRGLDTRLTDDELREQRVEFLAHLLKHMKNGQTIWFIDEMSTNLWERAPRIWTPVHKKFKVAKSRQ